MVGVICLAALVLTACGGKALNPTEAASGSPSITLTTPIIGNLQTATPVRTTAAPGMLTPTALPTAAALTPQSPTPTRMATARPTQTSDETGTVIWSDNPDEVAVLDGISYENHSPWSPTADDFLFFSPRDEKAAFLQIASAPNFQPISLTLTLDSDDLIWMPDGEKFLCSCWLADTEYTRLWSFDRSGKSEWLEGGIMHYLWFGDWVDSQHLGIHLYSGGGHIDFRVLDRMSGKFETWGAVVQGSIYPSQNGYVAATNIELGYDPRVLVISSRFPQHTISDYALSSGNVQLLPIFEDKSWIELSTFDDWRPNTDQMLVFWGNIDPAASEPNAYHLLVWDVAANTLGMIAPNGIGGKFSPDGRLLAYLTNGPATLDEASRPLPHPIPAASDGAGSYLQVMELDSGQVRLSLPTFSQWDSYDLVFRAHSYLQGGFSPDSRYLAFLTPGPLKLDAGGWPVGVDVSQKAQVRINVLDWKARKMIWSDTSSPEAVLVWSPDMRISFIKTRT